MQFNTSTLLALAYFSLKAAADSDYSASCSDISYSIQDPSGELNEATLSADCGSGTTSINLDNCFGFDDSGSLIAQQNGVFFGWACENISLDGTTLSAECFSDNSGSYVSSSIDTNDYIGNTNGQLTCYGETGDVAGQPY